VEDNTETHTVKVLLTKKKKVKISAENEGSALLFGPGTRAGRTLVTGVWEDRW
jgi:hypothetical protein